MPVGAAAFRTCVPSVAAILKTWIVQRCSTASAQATEGSTMGCKNPPATTGLGHRIITNSSTAEFDIREYLVSTTDLGE